MLPCCTAINDSESYIFVGETERAVQPCMSLTDLQLRLALVECSVKLIVFTSVPNCLPETCHSL